jgi:formate dehydrogenase subunit gamma
MINLLKTILIISCLLLPQIAVAQSNNSNNQYDETITIENPGTELWRNVRQRDGVIRGTSQMRGTDANSLINVSGEAWRQYRMLDLIPKSGIAILVTLICVFLFRILRGKVLIQAGRSGIKILRFTTSQRVVHWTTAILFIILAITGLLLLFGRSFLIPVIGAEAFSYFAVVAKTLHDYLGPAFAVSLTFLFIFFIKGNLPSLKQDLAWLANGGGMFGSHASADQYNAGEKGWFWIAAFVGGAIVVSGFVLDFPIFDQTRQTMEFYHVIHTIAASLMIIASVGHIYMGTIAMDGTLEVMKTGYCDSNWAQEHHDIWYEKQLAAGKVPEQKTSTTESSPKG